MKENDIFDLRLTQMVQSETENLSCPDAASILKNAEMATSREKSNNKLIELILSVIIIVVLSVVSITFIGAKLRGGTDIDGIKKISIVETTSGENILRIDFGRNIHEKMCYRIRLMDKDEKVALGSRFVEDDGLLGQYRIEIMFYDTMGVRVLSNEYPVAIDNEIVVHTLEDVPADLKSKFNIRVAYLDDSTSVIYIGSDEPISIEEQETTKIDYKKGNIEHVVYK